MNPARNPDGTRFELTTPQVLEQVKQSLTVNINEYDKPDGIVIPVRQGSAIYIVHPETGEVLVSLRDQNGDLVAFVDENIEM
jgi:hypothetical protein